MRDRASAPYWVASGALVGFGLIGLMTVGIPPGAGPVSCSFFPVSYHVMFAVFAGVAVIGLALRRPAGRAGFRES